MQLNWLQHGAKNISQPYREQARQIQSALTHPPGALGVLQQITVDFAGWQGHERPDCERLVLRAFGSHNTEKRFSGSEGHPRSTAIQQQGLHSLANALSSEVSVLQLDDLNAANDSKLDSLLSSNPVVRALSQGYSQLREENGHLLVGVINEQQSREAAEAVYAATLAPEQQSDAPQNESAKAFEARLIELLHTAGGLEIAALIGAYIGAAHAGMPMLVNGFIATAAALATVRLNPSIRQWMLFTHRGEHIEQQQAMQQLQAKPLLDSKLDACEKTRLTIAVDVIRSALRLNHKINAKSLSLQHH